MAVVPAAEAHGDERAVRDARTAQQRFERVRRANAPRKPGGSGSSRCDATIGRFCYWYDSTETEVIPEPPRIIEARLELLGALDSIAKRHPEDAWVAGQRVRYYIEAGKNDDALHVARSCRAEGWWCAALAGVAHHVAQQYVAADSSFAVALRGMPGKQRCEWVDISMIADSRWRRAFRNSSCERREELADIAFTLGKPLWMVAGSDLRTEHFTRHTMALIYDRSATAYGMSFGDDSREMMLRYGWPEWYTRHELGVTAFPSFAVTGHDREPTYHFFPDVPTLEHARPDDESWQLRHSLMPSRYAPRHIDRLTALPHQLGRFPRGDSLLLVATFRITDTLLERERFQSALTVLGRAGTRVVARGRDRSISGMVERDTLIVGVEVLGDSTNHAARARYTVAPLACRTWCLSDILVIDPTNVASGSGPLEAARAAYPDLRISASAPVGVFFEMSRAASANAAAATAAQAASFTLSIAPVRVSVARRIATTLRLAERLDAVRMRWQGVVGDGERRVIALQIPSSARGRYRMQLTVTPTGGGAVSASREIEFVR